MQRRLKALQNTVDCCPLPPERSLFETWGYVRRDAVLHTEAEQQLHKARFGRYDFGSLPPLAHTMVPAATVAVQPDGRE